MNKNGGKLAILVGILFAGAAALVGLVLTGLIPGTASAQEKPNPTTTQALASQQITVRGVGLLTVAPDTVKMNVGISIQDTTVKAAQAKVSGGINAMSAKLKAAGVDEKDYRTSQYNVEPIMEYSEKGMAPGTPKLTGFRVTNMLEITLRDPSRAPALLDALVDAGANTIYNVSYSFDNAERLTQQAYEVAVKDAAAKAGKLAQLSNLKLGRVLSVSEASTNIPGPVYGKDAAGFGGGGAGPVFPGQQQVQVDLIVTYEAAQ